MDRSFDLVLLTRFLAICAGAVTAYVLRSELAIGYSALAIVATSAFLNFGVYWLSPTRFSDFRRRISPIVGLGRCRFIDRGLDQIGKVLDVNA